MRLNIKFTSQTLNKLKSHPDFPSLVAFNYVLTQLGIENVTLRVPYEQMQNELPKPLLVHTKTNGGMYFVIAELDENKVNFINENGKVISFSKMIL